MSSAIQEMCSKFVDDLRTAIEADVTGKILASVGSRPASTSRRPGVGEYDVKLSGKRVVEVTPSYPAPAKKPRKKGPIQLCPVPRCKERAAPVFHMLCGKHKDTPKKLVAQYRAARRARTK